MEGQEAPSGVASGSGDGKGPSWDTHSGVPSFSASEGHSLRGTVLLSPQMGRGTCGAASHGAGTGAFPPEMKMQHEEPRG